MSFPSHGPPTVVFLDAGGQQQSVTDNVQYYAHCTPHTLHAYPSPNWFHGFHVPVNFSGLQVVAWGPPAPTKCLIVLDSYMSCPLPILIHSTLGSTNRPSYDPG
uniref:Uncharacterized protein n=1 Tax=Eutreptiella gymnastica TaxID=73025 RepID=A0A7S1NKM5_9EUGL|mmetsp:Transcript_50344/g.89953  ORF Transcript_50344/g.89953 Transcript_50344/m.89953 type:complete len:104 (+) Transcript_50344:102-413(+)